VPVLALPLWYARGPRFLALLLGLWVLVRVASHWPGDAYPDAPLPPPFSGPMDMVLAPDVSESRTRAVTPASTSGWIANARAVAHASPAQLAIAVPPSGETGPALSAAKAMEYSGSQRHAWRLALLGSLVVRPGATKRTLALPQPAHSLAPGLAPVMPHPRWPDAAPGRWSLAVAAYRRGGGGTPAVGPNSAARLGGSQSAVRLGYLVDPRFALRAYARATHTPGRNEGADIAIGVALRPLRAVPVDVHIERRTVVAGPGRDTTLVYAAGGVENQRLAGDFRLSAYGQAGLADYGEVVGFADAAVVVQREVARQSGMRLSLGTIVAAAAQPGARRVDVGPRAALVLPGVGHGAQLTLDWRERVAGNARPGSGLALTLAADF
jgi:hypothetical protein